MLVSRHVPRPDLMPIETYYRNLGQEGLVLCAKARNLRFTQCSSFKEEWGVLAMMAASGNPEHYRFSNQTRSVDNDTFLVINPDTRYEYELASERDNTTMMVAFPHLMVREITKVYLEQKNNFMEAWPDNDSKQIHFHENLTRYNDDIRLPLTRLMQACTLGETDKIWFYEQMSYLLEKLVQNEMKLVDRIEASAWKKTSTREELARRVLKATDYIHECYASNLTLRDMAGVACLSSFHFLKAFKRIHGKTPSRFVQEKRIRVACRLLKNTTLSISDIAGKAGFQDRTAFHRRFRYIMRMTPKTYRESV